MKTGKPSLSKSERYPLSSLNSQNMTTNNRQHQSTSYQIPQKITENTCIKHPFSSTEVSDIQASLDTQKTIESVVKQLLSYGFSLCSEHRLWRDVNDLKSVRDGIYASLRYETSFENSDLDKKAYLCEFTEHSRRNFQKSCNQLSHWKNILALFRSDHAKPFCPLSLILNAHFTALESICNALIETANCASPINSNCSLLYSLYSIAVIHFCNAFESFAHLNGKEVEKNNDVHQGKTQTSILQKYARIFNFPNWVVTCRNNLAHSSSRPPKLSFLHMTITYALKSLDRHFWSPLLLEASRVVNDAYSFNGLKSNSANNLCRQCDWQKKFPYGYILWTLPPWPPARMKAGPISSLPPFKQWQCSSIPNDRKIQGLKRPLNLSTSPTPSKRQKISSFYR